MSFERNYSAFILKCTCIVDCIITKNLISGNFRSDASWMGLCSGLSFSRSIYYASISQKTFRRSTDPCLSFLFISSAVYIHQNFGIITVYVAYLNQKDVLIKLNITNQNPRFQADLFSGALFIRSALGFEGESGLYVSVLILLALAAIFTIGGGLTAVIWTDFVQAILMVLGSIVLTALCKYLLKDQLEHQIGTKIKILQV